MLVNIKLFCLWLCVLKWQPTLTEISFKIDVPFNGRWKRAKEEFPGNQIINVKLRSYTIGTGFRFVYWPIRLTILHGICTARCSWIALLHNFKIFFYFDLYFVHISVFFDIKMTIKMELILDSSFYYPNALTQQKVLYFCRTKQNRQQEKPYLVYFLRWKATKLRLWPEALQNFLQTEYSMSCKDWHFGVSSFDADTRSHTHSYKSEANRRNDMRLVIIGRCFLILFTIAALILAFSCFRICFWLFICTIANQCIVDIFIVILETYWIRMENQFEFPGVFQWWEKCFS